MKSVNKQSLPLIPGRLALNSWSYRTISIQVALLCLLFLVIYSPTMASLVRMWWSSDDYSHGFLVPFISLYLAWIKRDELSRIRIEPGLWSGGVLVLFAGLMLVAGKLGGFIVLQELSLPLMIAGMVLLFAGKLFLKSLALPIAYLFFMIKMFGEGSDRFHRPFQLLAAKIGIGTLHLFGFTAYQEGNFIQLPNALLEVAAACSGIRFLVSIIAIGIPLAYLTQRTLLRRGGLVLFAIVIAILANGLRVALIGMWTYYHGTNMIHGPFHIFYGVFVSWIGFIALFGGAWFLRRGAGEDENALSSKTPVNDHRNENLLRRKWEERIQSNQWNRSWFIATLLLTGIGSYHYFHRISPVPLENGFTAFPMTIENWKGRDLDSKNEMIKVPKTDDELVRTYQRAENDHPVNVYVGYFDSQTEEKKLVTYTTSWKFHRGEEKVSIQGVSGQSYQVNEVILNDGGDRRAVLFWYDLNGRVVASRYAAKLWSLWDGLIFGRTNGALVALSIPLGPESKLEQDFNHEKDFLRDLIPQLHNYLDHNLGFGKG